jgi:GTP-binding protein
MAEDGIPGEYGEFDLELKIPAEVGLVGMPNAGKSTFLTTVTKARPEIGAYPFTTKLPQPGIVECDDFSRFTIMDVPGLLKGAVAGAGAGTEFLRHLERCKMIAYVVDISPDAMEPAWDALQILRDELQACKKALLGLAAVVIANKIDEDGADENLETLRQRTDLTVYPVSAILGEGCPEAIAAMKDVVKPPLPK